MTTSGTYLTRTFDLARLFDLTVRRCGVKTAAQTPEVIEVLRDNLQILLYDVRGLNLWCLDRVRLGFNARQGDYALPPETINVLKVNRRTPTARLSSTVTSSTGGATGALTDDDLTSSFVQGAASGNLVFDFADAKTVRHVGLLPAAAATHALEFATSSDGITWSVVELRPAESYVAKTWKWFELISPGNARYFRIRETGTGILGFYEIYLATDVVDLPMSPLNRDQYEDLPSKHFLGSPLQYWVDRQVVPRVVFWPVPGDAERYLQALVRRHRHVQDVGELTNELEVPARWYEAIVWELAGRSILEIPGADLARKPMIDAERAQHTLDTEAEERGGGPFVVMPNLAPYTR